MAKCSSCNKELVIGSRCVCRSHDEQCCPYMKFDDKSERYVSDLKDLEINDASESYPSNNPQPKPTR